MTIEERTELSDVDKVATRGGLATTVGITSADVLRWERVMEPSELGHIMTIGEFAIVLPNPLGTKKTISNRTGAVPVNVTDIAIQPTV